MLSLGKITKPQGLKGEMKVLPFGDFKMFETKSVFVDGKEYALEWASERPNGVFVKFVGIDTIEQANALKNRDIEIPIEKARELAGEDNFLWQDVLGSNIVVDGKVVGFVEDIDNFGSADIVFAKTTEGKEFSFPIVKGLVLEFGKNLVLDAKRFGEVVCYED